jgi:hypothetical protein
VPGGFGDCQRGGPPASVVPFRAQDADEVSGRAAEQAERCTAEGSIACGGGAGVGAFGAARAPPPPPPSRYPPTSWDRPSLTSSRSARPRCLIALAASARPAGVGSVFVACRVAVSSRFWIEVATGLAQVEQGAPAGCRGVEDGRLGELLGWQGREQAERGPDQRVGISGFRWL